ncbi:hypothetical protein Tsubulata_039959, partial [Turnera subulata]
KKESKNFFTFLVCSPLPLLRLSSPLRLSSFAYSSPSHRCSSTVIVIEMRGSTSKFAAFVELLQWCAIGALGGYSYVMYKTFNELHEIQTMASQYNVLRYETVVSQLTLVICMCFERIKPHWDPKEEEVAAGEEGGGE